MIIDTSSIPMPLLLAIVFVVSGVIGIALSEAMNKIFGQDGTLILALIMFLLVMCKAIFS